MLGSAHAKLLGPSASRLLIVGPLGLVEVRDLEDERVVGVGVGEEREDGEEDLRDGQCGAALLLGDVKANAVIRVDARMVHLT